MACTSPLYAWDTGRLTENGKPDYFVTRHPGPPSIVEVNKRKNYDVPMKLGDPLVSSDGHLTVYLEIPCGHCDSCLLARSRMWSERCMLEASLHDENWFLTLTYKPEFRPVKGSPSDVSKFMKDLRNHFGSGIRFFACGEYGASNQFHMHLILFNIHIEDLETKDANKEYYTSEQIAEIWPYGFHLLAPVTAESCAYVARYCMKKNPNHPGFITMSTNPGIGKQWFDEHTDEILRTWKVYHDFGNKIMSVPPRYFKKQCDKVGLAYEHHVQKAVKVAKASSLTDMASHHDRNQEEQRDRLREEARLRSSRLKIRRKL